jgi:hypothetical protein
MEQLETMLFIFGDVIYKNQILLKKQIEGNASLVYNESIKVCMKG